MQPEEYEVYGAYTRPAQSVSSAQVGVLEAPVITDTPTEQGLVESPGSPPEPPTSPPNPPSKRRRPGRPATILLLTLVLALIFSVGLFSGWEYAHTSTTTKAATSKATSSSGTSLQAQQEAAIAKVEPSSSNSR